MGDSTAGGMCSHPAVRSAAAPTVAWSAEPTEKDGMSSGGGSLTGCFLCTEPGAAVREGLVAQQCEQHEQLSDAFNKEGKKYLANPSGNHF